MHKVKQEEECEQVEGDRQQTFHYSRPCLATTLPLSATAATPAAITTRDLSTRGRLVGTCRTTPGGRMGALQAREPHRAARIQESLPISLQTTQALTRLLLELQSRTEQLHHPPSLGQLQHAPHRLRLGNLPIRDSSP